MNMMSRETDLEAGGIVRGVALAIVVKNDDPERICQVKVRYPWHDKPTESYWARLATPMAGNGRGLVTIPEVNDEVLVAFEREDLRFPYVLGSLWNGQQKPPVANNDGKNDRRTLTTRKGHRLFFDDGSSGVVELSHQKGRKVIFDDHSIALQDEKGNMLKIDCDTNAISIEAKGDLTIKANNISIQATANLNLTATAKADLKAATVNIN